MFKEFFKGVFETFCHMLMIGAGVCIVYENVKAMYESDDE